jgi:hypothetical protein
MKFVVVLVFLSTCGVSAQTTDNIIPTRTGGTAFFITGNRLMTALHATDPADYSIEYKGIRYPYRVIFKNVDQDVAVIQIPKNACKTPLRLSLSKPALGTGVMCYGWPKGYKTTAGQIVAYDSEFTSGGFGICGPNNRTGVKTTARIVPGYSGGPAMCGGVVVGVCTNVWYYSSLVDVGYKK